MNRERCLIVAEAGVNHNGRLDLALKLCDAAKSAGADVVKFQTWKTELLLTQSVEQAEYQVRNTGKQESQFEMLKRLELSEDSFRAIKEHCDRIGIVFASTADESESLNFLIELGIPFIKIGSAEIGNVSFLRYIGRKRMPVVLSTGMSTLSDVDLSVTALREAGAAEITLLHCTTDYPCAHEDANLRAMQTLRETFQLPVGYSDHTIGPEASVAAAVLGASIIEKHLTLDRSMAGPDHAASADPAEFAELVRAVRTAERCLGNGRKEPTEAERVISQVVRKRIVARRPIAAGEFFSEDNICAKRNSEGALASKWNMLVGRTAERSYQADEPIQLEM